MEKRETIAEQLFGEALDLPTEQRAAFLNAACRGSLDVRQAVEALLLANDRLKGTLPESPAGPMDGAAAESTHQLAPGTRLGRYSIVEPLGAGGMGVVYRARDEKLERVAAIKMLAPGVFSGDEARRRFRREALALAKLNHPNIAVVYDVGEQDGIDYIVMECVAGESLAAKMKCGPLAVRDATSIALQIAQALEEAHEHGVIHRDLKPANVIITPKGQAKVLDFGVAKLLEKTNATQTMRETGGLIGTALYMSPEQALGREVDERTDLWNLGVLYYEMLTGRPPFQGNSAVSVLRAITSDRCPPIRQVCPGIPEQADRIVSRAVEKDPARRYATAAEMVHDTQLLLSKMSGTISSGASGSARLQRIVLASLAAIVVLGALTGWWWHRGQHSQEQVAFTAVPFTALPEEAISPAFSPDGSRIAFAWNGDPAHAVKGFDLYVKARGSETLLRITQHPSESISPAWSPDGTEIAFQRLAGSDSGIYAVPALGGPERKLRSTRMPSTNLNLFSWHSFALISWSPDGKWIAFADVAPGEEYPWIYLLSTETLETKRVPISPQCVGEGLPAFSHNGEYLAYWCFLSENGEAALYSLPIRGSQAKTISQFGSYPNGLTWSPDDERLIYSLFSTRNGNLSSELGQVTVANGSTKQLPFAGSAMLPAVSARKGDLAYSSLSTSLNIWRTDLLHPESPAVELMPSSRAQFDAQYSPDGKRIAFVSFRSGIQGVWISGDDGSNLVEISNPHDESGSPQWSPDGNKIAFDSHPGDHWEIYLADVVEGKPRKLVTNISGVIRPHWSHDGKWIYFRSDGPGRTGIYRCPASGGDAIALAQDTDGLSPQESFDGKTVYFASSFSKRVLRKVSLRALPGTASEGGDGLPRVINAGVWTVSPGGIYFVPAEAPRSLRYFDFATKQTRPIFEVDKYFGSGLSVSPDNRWVLYSLVGNVNSDVMLVDHFQ